jgi:Carboxypeptidase regulatory-like domain
VFPTRQPQSVAGIVGTGHLGHLDARYEGDKVKSYMGLKSGLIILAFLTLGWTSSCFGQTPPPTPAHSVQTTSEERGIASASDQPGGAAFSGTISGTVVDQTGAIVAGAKVRLTRAAENQSSDQEVQSDGNGQFSFARVAPGPFQLTITSEGFATQTFSGILRSAETLVVPQIVLAVAADVTEVKVGVPQEEVAEEQIKVQEQQRVLGVLPNFYVSYIPDAAPLTAKQKFKLSWKTVADPVTILFVAGAAGVEQAQNHFAGYGQGAEGYGKRFGAGYADVVSGTVIGAALLPSLLKQDPRYFYKGSGSVSSRLLYAIANSVICKGDNRRWQPNYSNILGNLAAGGLSNLYYPPQDRNGAGLTFENAGIGIGATAVANLFEEFLSRKLTPKLPRKTPKNAPPPKP